MLDQYKLKCEAPACSKLASQPYWNDYVFVFLCADCMARTAKALFVRVLRCHRQNMQLMKSYVHTNAESGFQLEKDLAGRETARKRAAANKVASARRDILQLRAVFEATGAKVGAPEEALLLARTQRMPEMLPPDMESEIPFSDRSFF